MTGTNRKVFLRAFRSHWDCENRWRIDGDMAEWSLWHCFTEVFKKEFGSTSDGDPRLGVGHSDSSDISKLTRRLFTTTLAFFCSICSGLSTGCTNPARCAVEVWRLLVLVFGCFSTLERFKELGIFLETKFRMLKVLKWKMSGKNKKTLKSETPLAVGSRWKGAKGNCTLGQTKPCCASSQLRTKGLRGDNQRWRFVNNWKVEIIRSSNKIYFGGCGMIVRSL